MINLAIVFLLSTLSVTMVKGPIFSISQNPHSISCYRQSCEMKKYGGVDRWKCSFDGEGIKELCPEDSFCFEGQAKDSYLKFCIRKYDFAKNASRGDLDKIEDLEEICTDEKNPKMRVIPIFFSRGKECYCISNMCNNKLKLPKDFDMKDP